MVVREGGHWSEAAGIGHSEAAGSTHLTARTPSPGYIYICTSIRRLTEMGRYPEEGIDTGSRHLGVTSESCMQKSRPKDWEMLL